MNPFQDALISYGRLDSRAFAAKLTQCLQEAGFKAWFDFNDIPVGVDYQKQIDDAIDKADNFLFVISPHSVNSYYCGLEIKAAMERGKRIIPLLHVEQVSRETWQQRNPEGTDEEWDAYTAAGKHDHFANMHPVIRKINWVYFREGIDDFDTSFQLLLDLMERDRPYVHQHTLLLNQALTWQTYNRLPHYLLVEQMLKDAEAWLQMHFSDRQPPCEPTKLHCQFISESLKNAQDGMTEVFLCHAEENRATFDRIYATLARAGLTIWTSWHDIQIGIDYKEAILRGIENSDNFVYLLSSEAVRSSWCQMELDYALGLNKRIIPILVEPLSPRMIPPEIAHLQFIDLTDNQNPADYAADEKALLSTISRDADYYQTQKYLLAKALKWERQLRNPSILLRGKGLRKTVSWLEVARKHAYHRPLPIQEAFVQASLEQPTDSVIDVFLASNARDLEFTRKLNETLQVQGEKTWFEWDRTERSLEDDADIKDGITRADNCIFVISADALNDPTLLAEFSFAASLSKRIVVVSYQDLTGLELPPGLGQVLRVDFTAHEEDFLSNFGVLYRTLKSYPDHVREHTRLLNRALEWQEAGQDDSFLLQGKALPNAEAWLKQAHDKIPQPSELQQTYVSASRGLRSRKVKGRSLINLSLGATVLVLFARLAGLMQGLDWFAYDHFLRQRPNAAPDDRFLIITVDNDSGSYLREGLESGRFTPSIGSLPDDALQEALTILNDNQARLIGLDFFRDFPALNESLQNTLETTDNLITICKRSSQEDVGVPEAPGVAMERVGFADALGDRPQGIDYLRRHYLMETADSKNCQVDTSVSLLLAQRYLEQEGIPFTNPILPNGNFAKDGMRLGNVGVPQLQVTRGPYFAASQYEDLQGYQTLLNYRTAPNPNGSRAKDPSYFAPRASLQDLLEGKIPRELIEDRIVLIGYVDLADPNADIWETPYGEVSGVFLKGQMTSQLISAALNERSLIRWMPLPGELLWLLGWAIVGGVLVRQVVEIRWLSGGLAIAIVVLYGSCYGAMVLLSVTIPFFPPLAAFAVTAGGVALLGYRLRHPA